jgi:hypothetical protein
MRPSGVWADGLDGQEDELEDVQKGRLDPPTDDEGPGSVDEKNDRGRGLESEDEDDSLVEGIEESGVPDVRGETGPSDYERSIDDLDELARRAGVKLPN